MAFHEHHRRSFIDRLNRVNYQLKVGDHALIRSRNEVGIVIEKMTASEVASHMPVDEARNFIDRLNEEYNSVFDYRRYVVRTKSLIFYVDASDIEPDNLADEKGKDEFEEVEATRPEK